MDAVKKCRAFTDNFEEIEIFENEDDEVPQPYEDVKEDDTLERKPVPPPRTIRDFTEHDKKEDEPYFERYDDYSLARAMMEPKSFR